MTHVHFQPVGGAAGDMILASLVAAGAPQSEITGSLQSLGVAFELATERVEVHGVGALRATVTCPEEHSHRTRANARTLGFDPPNSRNVHPRGPSRPSGASPSQRARSTIGPRRR
ncbi:MAG: DUF111 family protein [Rubrobacter sp.]|nr:DUF111 family protein [Rubrobacter sp.]